jgi:DNA-binding transcriptional regulator WhiA
MELTPATMVEHLGRISKALDEQASAVEKLDQDFTAAKIAYKRDFARAFLSADGSVDVRRYTAEIATQEQFAAMELSDQVLRAGRESLRVLRDRLDVGRSLGAIMRMEWSGSS